MTDKIGDNFKQTLEEKIPLARFGEPDDVANAVLFLSSNLSTILQARQFMLMEECIFVDKVI